MNFQKIFKGQGGGPRVGMIFNQRGGGEGSDTNFLLRGERVGTRTKSQGGGGGNFAGMIFFFNFFYVFGQDFK